MNPFISFHVDHISVLLLFYCLFFTCMGEKIDGQTDKTIENLEKKYASALEGKRWPGLEFGEFVPCPSEHSDSVNRNSMRSLVSKSFISGSGIEIGALLEDYKYPVPASTTVKYVDSRSLDELKKHYPEFNDSKLLKPDYIDKAELLSTIASNSQDFVIASHVLEHTDNVLLAFENWFRVTKTGGALILEVPNKCRTFDSFRVTTSWSHMYEEYKNPEKVKKNRFEHYREWAIVHYSPFVGGVFNVTSIDATATNTMAVDYAIHFHTWDFYSFPKFLVRLNNIFPFVLRLYAPYGVGVFIVLEKVYNIKG